MPTPTVTRWPNGVCDATQDGIYANYAGMRPFRYYNWLEDFFSYTAADWVVTETDAGSTEAIVSGAGGVLAITNVSAGATDAAQIQWAGGSGAVVLPAFWDSTKDFLVYAKFKVSDATNTALLVGLASADTTVVASLPTNGIYFYKASGATSLIASVRKAGTSSSVTLGAMADDTYVEAALRFNSTLNTWSALLNNVLIGTLTTDAISPTAGVTPSIGLLNASAVAHVLSVDFMHIAVQR